ncbi:hypothetical protein QFC19_000092 [Naganishia cerealis]|uniref:Uncharacterized protein n=1 Tax=Naganishia cerealis TaxID=610337 RepID=A0ACC2WR35_9TREE|nr:hypothetical protein QFC19_000092 [Naganishia cerealis]
MTSSEDGSTDLADATPYDPATLQQRIQREILGLGALSDYLVEIERQRMASNRPESSSAETTVISTSSASRTQTTTGTKIEMIRIRLDDEYWVDMTPTQIDGFLARKSASLRSVEERRANLEQLKDWMIQELQVTVSNPVETAINTGNSVQRAPEPMPLGKQDRQVSLAGPQRQTKPKADKVLSTISPRQAVIDDVKKPPQSFTQPARDSTADQPDHAQKLEEINLALAKLGTSMTDVLKLGSSDASGDGANVSTNGTEVGQDGTVLNEEGLPFLDIREDLSNPIDNLPEKQVQSAVITSSTRPTDDYWSEEAIERRRKLRERLFGDEDDDDDEEEDEEVETEEDHGDINAGTGDRGNLEKQKLAPDGETEENARPAPLPAPESVSQLNVAAKGKGKAPSKKPGFMARSIVIDHSVETKAEEDDVESKSTKTGAKGKPAEFANVLPVSAQKISSTIPETTGKASQEEGMAQSERRKSVTFNPQTRVRLYEKGEKMPNSSPLTPAQTDPESRFEMLPDDEQSSPVVPPGTLSSTSPTLSSVSVRKDTTGGAFSGFKKGFLDSKPTLKQKQKLDKETTSSVSRSLDKSEVTTLPESPAVPPLPQPTIIESPEYQQPLAPAHDLPPARAKKQSLFAQRKAQTLENRQQLMNFSSFDPMVPADVDTGLPVTTGKMDVVPNPVKMAVVERPASKPKAPPTASASVASPIPLTPSPQPFPPRAKKARDSSDPAKDSGSPSAVRETIVERTPTAVPQAASQADTKEIAQQGGESDSDSLADFEYSDGEDAFDMDEALLAREAALAYHAKRSELGRKGLGGWTGNIGPDGEVEWDTELVPMSAGMEEAPPRVGPVAFGERIIPRGLEGIRLPGRDGDDDDGNSSSDEREGHQGAVPSISLPQIIPASENLASSIKIGKLENGNLVVQDTDDSDEDDADEDTEAHHEGEDDNGKTAEQRAARALAAEERRQRRAMIERLRSGDVEEMIREEQQRDEARRVNGYVEPPREQPPAVSGASPLSESRDTASAEPSPMPAVKGVVEKRRGGIVQKDIVAATPLASTKAPLAERGGREEEDKKGEGDVQPKKMSKFKAARLAAGSR